MNLASPLLTGFVASAATNLDDLVLLVAFFLHPATRFPKVVLGTLAGSAALAAGGVVLGRAALALSPLAVGALGLVPLWLGAHKLWKRRRARREGRELTAHEAPGVWAICGLTIAAGGDNLGVYAPLLSVRGLELAILVGVLVTGPILWCALARATAHHPALRPYAMRYGRDAVPYVYIVLGLAVIGDGVREYLA
ncbi:MAG: cadmium resistance transporter [Gammaproteobacteria bacterium]|nr:cadmium resistance transporter [Gammaproteobacteria bacterium]